MYCDQSHCDIYCLIIDLGKYPIYVVDQSGFIYNE